MLIQLDNAFSLKHSFQQFLFNTEAQVLHQNSPFSSFVTLNTLNEVVIRWTIFHVEQEGRSPYKAPFGSIEFDDSISIDKLTVFIKKVELQLTNAGIKSITVTNPPICYAENKIILLHDAFEKSGYQKLYTEINQHLSITQNFESHLHNSSLRRLKRTIPQFQFNIERQPDLTEIFHLIAENRQKQGHPLTISYQALQDLYATFQERFIVFTLRDQQMLIASAFGIIVNKEILYYFLPADHPLYKQHSPMLVILQQMYNYCQSNNMHLLDLGISTSKGIKNEGLLKFKQNIGGIESQKCTFVKQLV